MEIIVEGSGESYYTPDQIIMSLNFYIKEKSYEESLQKGSNAVLEFINKILIKEGFTKDDLKTNNFFIKRETKYNEYTKQYEFIGFSYNQNATLKFDYNKQRLSNLMEEISKIYNPPIYNINFTIKDITSCKKENLTLAYKNAEEQAKIIAEAAGKELIECVKTQFKPFNTEFISNGYNNNVLYESSKLKYSSAETINNVFTPEDILISEKIYCLWIAE